MSDRRDEFGNPIRRTDDEEMTGSAIGTYDTTTGYRAGSEGYGTTGYGVSIGGLRNPPEERWFGSERGRQQQQGGYGHGQTGSGQQQGHGFGQTGSEQRGYGSEQTRYRKD